MLPVRRPTAPIIGRANEIRQLVADLDRSRLVSLVGPGGVGKTALALELAHELDTDVRRIAAVGLEDAEPGSDVLRLLSSAVLGEPSTAVDLVARALDGVPSLLIVDNCEQVIDDVAAVVAELLAHSVELRLVTTSRRPLGLAAETIRTVEPLPVPDRHDDNSDLTTTGAAQLFLERVYQAVPSFELTDSNRATVAAICVAADGLPLALELAAALVRTTPLDEILQAMTQRPADLDTGRRVGPARQRTLSASLAWSRRFLTATDGHLLNGLAIFAGGFTAAAARAVGGDDAGSGLARLVDHSLVSFDPAGDRYRLLDVVRVDAVARLGDEQRRTVTNRHLTWCLSVVEAIEAGRFDADPDNRFPLFELELPNLCAALRRCQETDDMDGFRSLLGPIALWWVHYMPPTDPDLILGAFEVESVPVGWRANVTSAMSFVWSHQGHHERSRALARRSRELHEQAGDLIGRSLAEVAVGNAEVALGNPAAAAVAYREALNSALATGHPYPELLVRVALARLEPDAPHTGRHLTEALELARQGFGALEAVIGAELGVRALRAGRRADAARLCDQAVACARNHGYREALATALCGRGEVALASADHDTAGPAPSRRAASLLGGFEPLSERELAVARLLRGDLTQREIADELYIAPSTVKSHVKAIYRKLGVTKRSHAVTRAIDLELFA